MTDKNLESLNLEGVEGLTQSHLDQLSWAMLDKEEKRQSYKNMGILSLWIAGVFSLFIGIWQTTWGSPACIQVQCPYTQVTHLSIGVAAFFLSTISFVVGCIIRFGWHQKAENKSGTDGLILTQAILDLEKEGIVKRNSEPPLQPTDANPEDSASQHEE